MNKNNLENIRHSFSHVLMQALERLYGAVPGVGPAIENGFYHDFDCKYSVKPEDLLKIEKVMRKIIKENLKIEKKEMPIDEAIKFLKEKSYIYTAELAEDLRGEGEKTINFFRQGDFINMCKGSHVQSTGELDPKAFKLTRIAGAYWKASEDNKMIQRIYGVAFESEEELQKYLIMLEEAEKRDHRKLGREMDLFSISEKVGPGLVLWHPNLSKTREVVEDFWRKMHRRRGYDAVFTPHIGRAELWKTSGHIDFFKESMYSAMNVDGEDYYVKPMNCPFHVEIYKSRPRSWKEFPFRWNEMGSVYRYEKSGELHGMSRVRGFTQDDAHVICREDQFEEEYRGVLKFTFDMFKVFGFSDLKGYLAIRDSKKKNDYMGGNKIWDTAEKTIKEVVAEFDMPYEVEEGGAKFYGPALDIKAKDSLGREWQLTTIQLDFNLPQKFDMKFTGSKGEERPIMIHRALLGSLERFFSILIEHYGGAFPVWLAPVQVKIISVGEAHIKYCNKLAGLFMKKDIRVKVDSSDETVGNKIRKAISGKVPYMLVIGDKEIASENLMVRDRGAKEAREISEKDFVQEVLNENCKQGYKT